MPHKHHDDESAQKTSHDQSAHANGHHTRSKDKRKTTHDEVAADADAKTESATSTAAAATTATDQKSPLKKHKSDAAKPAAAAAASTGAAAAVAATVNTETVAPALTAANADGTEAPDAAVISVATNGKETESFRNYKNSSRQAGVEAFYKEQHAKQTYEFVAGMEQKYSTLKMGEMGLWECLEFMDSFVDDSDPDTEHSQMQHALQTAEAIRAAYPDESMDWFCVTGLIHDLGKLLGAKGGEPQFCVVGDTHPVGCAFAEQIVFHKYFDLNPDTKNQTYSTKNGIYTPGCGLANIKMSYGHDEYLYQVVTRNGCTLPPSALAIIRFHSFYSWHNAGAYRHLMNEQDKKNLEWVQAFQKFDLYSKAHTKYDPKQLRPIYQQIINKYFPKNGKLNW